MKKLVIALLVATAFATPAAAQLFGGGDPFADADTNHDGIVTKAEFAAKRAASFVQLDRNGDGFISRDDFGRLAKLRPQAMERLNALIAAGDANHDGKLSREELANAPMPLFERADANHDGRIDQAELTAAKAMAAQMRGTQG